MASPSTVISLGYGSWGTDNEVITLGYGIGEAAEEEVPATVNDAIAYTYAVNDTIAFVYTVNDAVEF